MYTHSHKHTVTHNAGSVALHSLGIRSGKGKHGDLELGEKSRARALQSITDHSIGHMLGVQEDHHC